MNPEVPPPPLHLPLKPGRRFLRFDWLFNDAVRSKRRSKLIEVLLRLHVPADTARRTADKILREQN
jgi:hypothetical protein